MKDTPLSLRDIFPKGGDFWRLMRSGASSHRRIAEAANNPIEGLTGRLAPLRQFFELIRDPFPRRYALVSASLKCVTG